jgi:hypothetical protein
VRRGEPLPRTVRKSRPGPRGEGTSESNELDSVIGARDMENVDVEGVAGRRWGRDEVDRNAPSRAADCLRACGCERGMPFEVRERRGGEAMEKILARNINWVE